MLTFDEIRDIVALCSFEHPHETWLLEVKRDGDRAYLQVRVLDGTDSDSGLPMEWTGRKWMLSPHMVKNEIVATAFKAVMTAMEHEVREMFRYRKTSIFNPHVDPDAMVDFINNPANMQSREDVAFGV